MPARRRRRRGNPCSPGARCASGCMVGSSTFTWQETQPALFAIGFGLRLRDQAGSRCLSWRAASATAARLRGQSVLERKQRSNDERERSDSSAASCRTRRTRCEWISLQHFFGLPRATLELKSHIRKQREHASCPYKYRAIPAPGTSAAAPAVIEMFSVSGGRYRTPRLESTPIVW